MSYWDCPKCAAENSLDANSCWRCGFRNYGQGRQPASPADPANPPRHASASIASPRDRLREGLRKSVDDALERDRARLDRLARRAAGGGKAGKDS